MSEIRLPIPEVQEWIASIPRRVQQRLIVWIKAQLKELAALRRQAEERDTPPLPPPPVKYGYRGTYPMFEYQRMLDTITGISPYSQPMVTRRHECGPVPCDECKRKLAAIQTREQLLASLRASQLLIDPSWQAMTASGGPPTTVPGRSLTGRSAGFEPENAGSNPAPASKWEGPDVG